MASGENNEEEYYSSPEEAEDDDEKMSYRSASNDSDPGESDGDDSMGYNDDDDDDYGEEDESMEEEEEGVMEERREREERYAVLTMDAVRARQEEHAARVADLVALTPAQAAAVLRHFKWSAAAVEDGWFANEQRVRDAVGLPQYSCSGVSANAAPLTCAICFDVHPAGAMRSAGCQAHFYCCGCWSGYVRAAVEDGARCLSIRCPDTSCSAAVVQDLVDDVADPDDARRYAEFLARSYVEESKKLRWCPAPGCDHAVEFLDGERCTVQLDADCMCGYGFCLGCGEEAHRPVSCDTVRAWLVKNGSDSETANWVLANTKHCPECRRPIEKNQGCMHMTCSPPCRHEFCWLCLGSWKNHNSENGGFYQCNRYQAAKREGKFSAEEVRRQQAQASVDRYLHYYERWAAHERSRNKALEDLAALGSAETGKMEESAAAFGVLETEMDFLKDAYRQVAECRRMLRWTYAFGFFVEEPAKLQLFQMLQTDAETSLERLHGCAEKERVDIVATATATVYSDSGELVPQGPASEKYAKYREKLSRLTMVTRDHFENLARAFRDGLTEVDTKAAAANATANAAKAAKAAEKAAELADPVASTRFLFTEDDE
ncbi:hypothetical protein QYE76_007060 [Lolium multiflorum]|uniref:RBR-type E3 ubiquitin transferase n=1 Tax=Lolium multiflorum TaxID=4521 RepID=A0AAD8W2C6_LOLMU|nr:hypothetical protein QYE76_007060 [Lolium multiflorum]